MKNILTHSKSIATKILFVGLSVGAISTSAHATKNYAQCNICVNGDHGDPGPRETYRECKTWFKAVATPGAYTQIIRVSKVDLDANNNPELKLADANCDHVELYGSFHANESYLEFPFLASAMVSQMLHAKSLNYTGSSCDIFHDVDKLEETAAPLATLDTNFVIEGNQNVGWVTESGHLFRRFWSEPVEAGSKAIVTIENKKVSLSFQKCSEVESSCTVDLNKDSHGGLIPATKMCSDEKGIARVQTCCPTDAANADGETYAGSWSEPAAKGSKAKACE